LPWAPPRQISPKLLNKRMSAATRLMPSSRLHRYFGAWWSQWTHYRHPCKSLVKEKARGFRARSGERVVGSIRLCCCARLPLGGGSCSLAEPDIHLLPQADKSHRRRLSLCSLPVPKQCKESLRSHLHRPGDLLQDLAACAPKNPDVFLLLRRIFQAAACGANAPAEMKSVLRLSTANRYATIFLATASTARLVFPRCRSRS
jgi:hypothetical protein